MDIDDLSTNRHSSTISPLAIKLNAELSFPDGDLIVVCNSQRYLLHQSVLARHSKPLATLIDSATSHINPDHAFPCIELSDLSTDALHFLKALYDGLYGVKFDPNSFMHTASLLQMATKYEVQDLRKEILQGLAVHWPHALGEWDAREARATNADGVYDPRRVYTHPILVINLARQVCAPELLSSAFYDLSRSSPSEIASGYKCRITQQEHHLSESDLLRTLRGREHGSRFLSTFIVHDLEGKEPADNCLRRHDLDIHRRRSCQTAFETITFEILRDVNGVVCQRSADPLFAILDAELMQSKDRSEGPAFRACENCTAEFGIMVDQARTELWNRLPEWFGLQQEE